MAFPEKMVGPSEIVGPVGPWNETHTIVSHTLHFDATVVGLKALHGLLNKRLEQQIKNKTARSSAHIVPCS